MITRWFASLALLLMLSMPAPAAEISVLTPAEAPTLLEPPPQGVRVLMLWALYCHYCEANMSYLAQWQKEQTDDVELILVATDPIQQHDELAARLDAAGMAAYPARAYSEASPERLNFILDSTWGGELPRTLVIHADGRRLGTSGRLSDAQLQKLDLPPCRTCNQPAT